MHLLCWCKSELSLTVPPRTPTDVSVSNVTATSATILWTIPEILYSEEEYYVEYGLQNTSFDQTSSSLFSGADLTVTDVMYNITLLDLHPAYTYYFVVTSLNTVSPKSTDVFMFTTLEAGTATL